MRRAIERRAPPKQSVPLCLENSLWKSQKIWNVHLFIDIRIIDKLGQAIDVVDMFQRVYLGLTYQD